MQFVKGVVQFLKGDGQLVKGADSLKLLSKLAVFPLLLIIGKRGKKRLAKTVFLGEKGKRPEKGRMGKTGKRNRMPGKG